MVYRQNFPFVAVIATVLVLLQDFQPILRRYWAHWVYCHLPLGIIPPSLCFPLVALPVAMSGLLSLLYFFWLVFGFLVVFSPLC